MIKEIEELSTFDYMRYVMLLMAGISAQVGAYHKSWGAAYSINKIVAAWKDSDEFVTSDRRVTLGELQSLSEDELKIFGFGRWNEDGLWLIPLWILNYLAPGIVVESISSEVKVIGIDEIDLDTRFGCIAYGFYRDREISLGDKIKAN